MPCDIHAHIEIKINSSWEHYTHLIILRDYELFGRLAGVCRTDLLIFAPKGLPDGLSVITKMHVREWETNGHTHTWLSADEIKQLNDEYCKPDDDWWYGQNHLIRKAFGHVFGNLWCNFNDCKSNYPKAIEDIRLVCWFNN